MSEPQNWWWIRHAPVPDAPTFLGWTDAAADLSDRPALEALARALPDRALWLSSDLARARDTARALGGEPAERAALREQHFGDWEGGAPPGPALDAFWRDPAATEPPGGESFATLCARIADVVDSAHRNPAPDRIVVAHAGVVRAAVAQALGLEPRSALSVSVAPLSLTRLTWFGPADAHGRGGGWAVETLNWRPLWPPLEA